MTPCCARSILSADVAKLVAAAIVVILLATAVGRAAEDGEDLDKKESQTWEAGTAFSLVTGHLKSESIVGLAT